MNPTTRDIPINTQRRGRTLYSRPFVFPQFIPLAAALSPTVLPVTRDILAFFPVTLTAIGWRAGPGVSQQDRFFFTVFLFDLRLDLLSLGFTANAGGIAWPLPGFLHIHCGFLFALYPLLLLQSFDIIASSRPSSIIVLILYAMFVSRPAAASLSVASLIVGVAPAAVPVFGPVDALESLCCSRLARIGFESFSLFEIEFWFLFRFFGELFALVE